MSIVNNLKQEKDEANRINKVLTLSKYSVIEELYKDLLLSFSAKSCEEAIKEFRQHYPKKEWWRLFVDGCFYAIKPPRYYWPIKDGQIIDSVASALDIKNKKKECYFLLQEDGWVDYEGREANSVLANLKALSFALTKLGQSRDEVAFVKEIQRLLTEGTSIKEQSHPGQFKSSGNGFLLAEHDLYDLTGFLDLMNQVANGSLRGAYLSAAQETTRMVEHLPDGIKKQTYQKIVDDILSPSDFEYTQGVLQQIQDDFPRVFNEFLHDLGQDILAGNTDPFYHAGLSVECVRLYNATRLKRKENTLLSDEEKLEIAKIFRDFSPNASSIQGIMNKLPSELLDSLTQEIKTILMNPDNEGKAYPAQNKCFQYLHQLIAQKEVSLFDFLFSAREIDAEEMEFMEEYAEVIERTLADELMQKIVDVTGQAVIEKQMEELVQAVFDRYHEAIAKPHLTDGDKLCVIGHTLQTLERLHPFRDANGRTFANVLCTILLLENGFPPPTYYEPNLFAAFSEIVGVLKRGIANTIELYEMHKNENKIILFGLATDHIENKIKKELEHLKDTNSEFHQQKKQRLERSLMKNILQALHFSEVELTKAKNSLFNAMKHNQLEGQAVDYLSAAVTL